MQKITPFLWIENQAEEAANFYASVFKNSKIGKISRYGEAGPGPEGSVMVVSFQLEGEEFLALNGGPLFKFTEAISLSVNCETQEEVDEFWPDAVPTEPRLFSVPGVPEFLEAGDDGVLVFGLRAEKLRQLVEKGVGSRTDGIDYGIRQ